MARGQKTTPEKIYEVIASYAVTNNYSQTARATGLPASTVKDIVDNNKNTPEFEKLRDETRTSFAESATNIIEKAMRRLESDIENKDDIPINHLVIAIGTLTDKKLLIEGKATDNVTVSVKLPEGIDEYAG